MTLAQNTKIKSPLSNNLFLGYVSKVTSRNCDVHFPNAALLRKFWNAGEEYIGGIIGSYVIIEGENHGFLAVIQEIGLSENDIYSLDRDSNQHHQPFHPDGKLEVLLSFDFFDLEVKKGLDSFPIAGSRVYLCPQDFLTYLVSKADFRIQHEPSKHAVFSFCKLANTGTDFQITPNSLFERHCAVVGTTGGGKSYTIAQLVCELGQLNKYRTKKQKCILIDATGEFRDLAKLPNTESYYFGSNSCYPASAKPTFFHYSRLRISDLIALLRPGGQVQRPKLLEAIRSLKMAHLISSLSEEEVSKKPFVKQCDIQDGNLMKQKRDKAGFKATYGAFTAAIEADNAKFNILKLGVQIKYECVYDSNPNAWGDWNLTEGNNVSSLVSRLEHTIYDPHFSSVFGFEKGLDYEENSEFCKIFSDFMENDNSTLLLSLDRISFDFGLREILVNAIGRLLLEKARAHQFLNNPLLLIIDEAHQFLKKSVRDEYFAEVELDSFDKIAKECRKHGLYLCISTQMPRDIPDGTLSQMGTFIVHRLINEQDREKIQSACSEANKHSLSYLPVLGEGTALLISVSLPMPLLIKVNKPMIEPVSKAPQLFANP